MLNGLKPFVCVHRPEFRKYSSRPSNTHFLRLNNSKVLEITSFIFSVYQCHFDFYFNASNRRKNESFKPIESEYIVLDQIF